MTRRVVSLPAAANYSGRNGFTEVGSAKCPCCGHQIGPDARCRHVVDLLTPPENGGRWGVLVDGDAPPLPKLTVEARVEREREPAPPKAKQTRRKRPELPIITGEPVTVSELAALTGRAYHNVAVHLARLCVSGEARVAPRPRNGRRGVTRYVLTEAGKERIQSACKGGEDGGK